MLRMLVRRQQPADREHGRRANALSPMDQGGDVHSVWALYAAGMCAETEYFSCNRTYGDVLRVRKSMSDARELGTT